MAPQCLIRLDSFKNNFFNEFMKLQHVSENNNYKIKYNMLTPLHQITFDWKFLYLS